MNEPYPEDGDFEPIPDGVLRHIPSRFEARNHRFIRWHWYEVDEVVNVGPVDMSINYGELPDYVLFLRRTGNKIRIKLPPCVYNDLLSWSAHLVGGKDETNFKTLCIKLVEMLAPFDMPTRSYWELRAYMPVLVWRNRQEINARRLVQHDFLIDNWRFKLGRFIVKNVRTITAVVTVGMAAIRYRHIIKDVVSAGPAQRRLQLLQSELNTAKHRLITSAPVENITQKMWAARVWTKHYTHKYPGSYWQPKTQYDSLNEYWHL